MRRANVNVRIPREIHRDIKSLCAMLGCTLSSWYADAIATKYLLQKKQGYLNVAKELEEREKRKE